MTACILTILLYITTQCMVPTPFKTQFTMTEGLTKFKRVYLKSFEMVHGFVNIRTGSTDTLKFTLNGTAYGITLTEKPYSTIDSLITDINTALVGVVTNVTITLAQTGSLVTPNRLKFTFTGSVRTTSFSITNTNLSKYVLRFRKGDDSLIAGVYTASCSNWNLNSDNYILLHIPSLNFANTNTSGFPTTFKIPLNSVYNQTLFYQELVSFIQFIDIDNPSLVVKDLIVTINDKYGLNLNPNGNDWSMTLAFEIWN